MRSTTMRAKIKNTILLILIALGCCIVSCKTIQYIPIKGDTVVEYRDTTIWKDSLIYTPIEIVKEVVPYMEPLYMETSLAKATAYVDTSSMMLKGKIENKKGVTENVKWREKIVYKDSISVQEVPVEIQVEKIKNKHYFYEPVLWLISVLSALYFAIKILKKKYGL